MKPVKKIVTFTVVIVCGWVVARTGFSGHGGSGDFAVANNHEHYDAQEGDHDGREKGIHGFKSTQCSARYSGQRPFLATREQLSLIGWMRNSGCRRISTTLSRLMVFGLTVELFSWR